jgi:hypothetical protein
MRAGEDCDSCRSLKRLTTAGFRSREIHNRAAVIYDVIARMAVVGELKVDRKTKRQGLPKKTDFGADQS